MCCAALLFAALNWTLPLLDQPLWLDELHSSWVVAGDWSEVASRAEMGNQSPSYFWLLKLLTWTSGHHPWVLRVPSLLSWLACVVTMFAWLGSWQLRLVARKELSWRRLSYVILALLFCSICVDPMQMFFAVEARVYGIVQLLNLWSWMLVVEIVARFLSGPTLPALDTTSESCTKIVPWHWIVWTVCASTMLHLHITAGLSLIFQFPIIAYLAAKLVSLKQLSRRNVVLTTCCLVWISTNGIYVLYVNQNVWERRQQWTAFAGDSSLASLIHLMPVLQVLLPVAVCCAIDLLLRKRSKVANGELTASQVIPKLVARSAWTLAAICPCFLAWILTRCELAPLLHYRFVIVAALPLYVLAGTWLLTINRGALRVLASAAIFGAMFVSQGPWGETLDSWPRARDEDWKSATEFVSQNIDNESQSLWCYAGLIEGYQIDPPLSHQMDEYLSFPLRGIYRVEAGNLVVEPHGLVGNRQRWLDQIRSTKQDKVWIIYRGPTERLKSDMEAAGIGQLILVHTVEEFGRVSVVCVRL